MKICAITMVYRDHWALSQWYAHYARHLGAQNLYVISHGEDPAIATICPQASIITIPREDLDNFDLMRGRMLNSFQAGLSEIYDWIIRTDADELICLDPAKHGSFAEFFAKQTANAVFALGLNIAETGQDAEMRPGMRALEHRSLAMFSSHYSKAWAVRRRLGLRRHGVEVRPRFTNSYPFEVPAGVYLAHLKFANSRALAQSDKHRSDVAARCTEGAPGWAWRNPSLETRKFFERMRRLPLMEWADAEPKALAHVNAEPIRDPEIGVIRVRDIPIKIATRLPGWFKSA